MHYLQWAQKLLFGMTVEDKTFQPIRLNFSHHEQSFILPDYPGRSERINFSSQQLKFPKVTQLYDKSKLAQALHSFANHELLAIEMMSCALLKFHQEPHFSQVEAKILCQTIMDEQLHFKLYLDRINELGYSFGDFIINDFFWKQMKGITHFAQFSAVMSLTFEAANLDFAQFYLNVFKKMGDEKSAQIMYRVLVDEINHVKRGAYVLKKKCPLNFELWDYYRDLLPFPLTPARSKGIEFNIKLREQTIADSDFIQRLLSFEDNFKITRRKDCIQNHML